MKNPGWGWRLTRVPVSITAGAEHGFSRCLLRSSR
jgi:hypothetical protein